MANIKNYGMTGIAADVQFGKAGPRLINDTGVFKFKNTAGSDFADLQAANLVLTGDLTVQGATTTIETTTLKVEDKNIEVGVTYDGNHNEIAATDAGADGGGLTLKGTTDKTLEWLLASGAWTSSESFDLVSGKTYKIGGVDVLSASALGSSITSSSLTSLGTLTGLTVASSSSLDFGGNKLTNVGAGTAGTDAVNFTQLSGVASQASSDLSDAIASEVTARNSAISSAISQEVTDRDAAIAVETSRAEGVESGLQTELDTTQTGAGLSATGTYVASTTSNYLNSATSLFNADMRLDSQIKTVADAVAALGSGSITNLQTEVDAIETSLGGFINTDGTWNGFTGTNYLNSAGSATAAFTALDTELFSVAGSVSTVSSDLASEISRAEGAESALGTRIDNLTTSDVAEGSNLYYTDARARLALSVTAGNGLVYNNTTGVFSIDQDVIATVSYVDTQDAATLADAKAYADSLVGTSTVHQAKGVYAAFAYTDTAVTIASITGRVHRVKVYIDAAFAGTTPTVQVGTDATNGLIAAVADIDPTGAGVYVVELNQNFATATDIKVFVGGTSLTAGNGSVIVEYLG